jgi:hypothetical protein
MEFNVPAGSRMNPSSTPLLVVDADPSAVWWTQSTLFAEAPSSH